MRPNVSIITVSYNAEKVIDVTIQSVLSQNYCDYEYIFVDGKSSDGTVDKIREYQAAFEQKGVTLRIVSEPDDGIYDAMNKGSALANGQWVLMLNAGDSLANEYVLETFFAEKNYSADIVYGDVIYSFETDKTTYYKRNSPPPLEKIKEGMIFCHQCVFVRLDVINKYRFDTQYKIVADYDSFIRAYMDNVPFQYVDKVVAVYDCSGLSTVQLYNALEETMRVKENAGLQSENNMVHRFVFLGKHKLRALVQKIFPKIAFARWRGWCEEMPNSLL